MNPARIDLDWSKLLGFSQAKPGTDVLKNAPKIGSKQCPGVKVELARIRA
jgi:hypothetical protein